MSLIFALVFSFIGCQPTPVPPVAKIKAERLVKHNDLRIDNYFWMKDRENPEVKKYLDAENIYTNAVMKHTEKLQQKLFAEFQTRIKQTDLSVPYKEDDYYYYSKTIAGKDYPVYCRKKTSADTSEHIMLDLNAMSKGHGYFSVSAREISTNQNLIAYGEDTVGRRFYTLHVKNLTTGEITKNDIPMTTGQCAWANDNKTIFYSKQDPGTLRSFQVYRHVLGTDVSTDKLMYEEKDNTFKVSVFKTKSKKFILIESNQTLSSEYRFLDADAPTSTFKVFLPREKDHLYSIDHFRNNFYIRTNYKAKNFRLMTTPISQSAKQYWTDVIPHRDSVLFEGFEIFKNDLVVIERKAGLINLRIKPWKGAGEHYVDFGEPTYAAFLAENYEFDTPIVRYSFSSMTTPRSIYDYNMETKEKKLLKQDEVLGGFARNNYQSERVDAAARDGKHVPLSIVYRKGLKRDGNNPLLLYGYGSYGASTDASFSPYVISLLDRGFVYAIAHIRGGEELGRQWYEDGKLLKKKNTFTDFIDCAEYLVKNKFTQPEKLFIRGGSAGGLLIGAVINMRPDLFKGAVADVPFVDVITTMLDESIPLTTAEYDEWGNPTKKEYYDYILTYSPYDRVEAKHYPNLLVTTGFHDSQVQYWEPAKWVAKLRALKKGDTKLILKTEMEAGHGGASGRNKRYKNTAFMYAFLLDLAGIDK
jgi:oligopeptidase B